MALVTWLKIIFFSLKTDLLFAE